MKRWRWVVLIFELLLFAVVLVLPQVDLPDFAFHRDSAPIVVKSKVSSAPVLANIAIPLQAEPPQAIGSVREQQIESLSASAIHSLLSLLCTLLC
jgi:hypothetical protein